MKFDPITLEILWQRLVSAADEAGAALLRSSFSTIVRESYDFACIVTDTKGRSIAQASESIPSFIGTLPRTVKHFLAHFPVETLKAGDILITNDPWMGTGHLPDLSLAKPMFAEGRFIGMVATTAHAPDMGGKTGSADVRDIFEEGLQVPMMKLMDAGVANETLIAMIRKNTRVPDQVIGDLWAQIAALQLLEQRSVELARENRFETLDELADEIIGRTERAMRDAIAKFPDGQYEYSLQADGLSEPLTLKVAIDVDGERIKVDYAGSSNQVDRGINVALCYTASQTAYALKCLLSPDLPNNEGACCPSKSRRPKLDPQPYLSAIGTEPHAGGPLPAVPDFRRIRDSGAAPHHVWCRLSAVEHAGHRPGRRRTHFREQDFLQWRRRRSAQSGWLRLPELAEQRIERAHRDDRAAVAAALRIQTPARRIRRRRRIPGRLGPGGPAAARRRASRRHRLPCRTHPNAGAGRCGGRHGSTGVLQINGRALTPAEQKRQHRVEPGDVVYLATPGGGGFGDPEKNGIRNAGARMK